MLPYWIATLGSVPLGIISTCSQLVSGSSELLLSGQGGGEAGVASRRQPLSWAAVSLNHCMPVVQHCNGWLLPCQSHRCKIVS